ncbi:type I-F CRISPR-associated endoribonuclease Cas6/Csy4 [Vibrio cholerae]|uniref:type I-F CRISPR-associated endoribonuclease Cas6/Csy4 n=2 Tax=Vibrio cholerae TaxID=666 RepID=UPI0018F07762|nr:type I-F CRISPR-associated endoribonuclease Cas6/Csy4 [Vibrio cholerae]EGR2120035.1 type I-F CRISPR-associated endoribonuclease Cas6/Csy4 [Vibrio cholerae]MBJ6910139.1 type I-F CRISPR-associated endoribonuclease Cas6/Csy4 [Vibrio cholerae]MCX9461868.1 type I-F CRISPR-associated endoribonuclease Cas6/Csy4 [Vibrio cholerae]HDI3181985.1 type I-F CRISPR-associated endoribonuclease Cas6/Csy4 [Vibrio cholerae]
MNFYIELQLLPDQEVNLGYIWQKVFQQVHIALVEHKVASNQSLVAVGFPDYRQAQFPLGSKLRLFAKEQVTLEKLDIHRWLTRLEDYVHIKGIKPVPNDVTYVSFVRKQVKSPERIERDMQQKAELWAAKSGKPLVECLVELQQSKPTALCTLPFIYLHSQQTKLRTPEKNSKFPLFIQMQQQSTSQDGSFDCYGLSSKANGQSILATVPHF